MRYQVRVDYGDDNSAIYEVESASLPVIDEDGYLHFHGSCFAFWTHFIALDEDNQSELNVLVHSAGYEKGYNTGHTEGYEKGHSAGYDEGYDEGHSEGYDMGIGGCDDGQV